MLAHMIYNMGFMYSKTHSFSIFIFILLFSGDVRNKIQNFKYLFALLGTSVQPVLKCLAENIG